MWRRSGCRELGSNPTIHEPSERVWIFRTLFSAFAINTQQPTISRLSCHPPLASLFISSHALDVDVLVVEDTLLVVFVVVVLDDLVAPSQSSSSSCGLEMVSSTANSSAPCTLPHSRPYLSLRAQVVEQVRDLLPAFERIVVHEPDLRRQAQRHLLADVAPAVALHLFQPVDGVCLPRSSPRMDTNTFPPAGRWTLPRRRP